MGRPLVDLVTEAQLRRAHRVLRIATPFEGMSELLRRTVAAAARAMAVREHRAPNASIDLKRRAAGDFED